MHCVVLRGLSQPRIEMHLYWLSVRIKGDMMS